MEKHIRCFCLEVAMCFWVRASTFSSIFVLPLFRECFSCGADICCVSCGQTIKETTTKEKKYVMKHGKRMLRDGPNAVVVERKHALVSAHRPRAVAPRTTYIRPIRVGVRSADSTTCWATK